MHESLSELGFYRQLARVLLGQAWYLVAASFGCAVLGVLAGGGRPGWHSADIRAGDGRADGAGRGCVHNVGLARARPVRADYLVYGRYIDSIVMVLAALGVAALFANRDAGARRRSVVTVLATFATLAGLVWVMLPDYRLPPYEPNIAGVIPAADRQRLRHRDVVDRDRVAFVAVVGVSRLPGRWSVLALAVLFGGASIGASSMAMEIHDRWVKELQHVDVPAPGPGRRHRGGRGRGSGPRLPVRVDGSGSTC